MGLHLHHHCLYLVEVGNVRGLVESHLAVLALVTLAVREPDELPGPRLDLPLDADIRHHGVDLGAHCPRGGAGAVLQKVVPVEGVRHHGEGVIAQGHRLPFGADAYTGLVVLPVVAQFAGVAHGVYLGLLGVSEVGVLPGGGLGPGAVGVPGHGSPDDRGAHGWDGYSGFLSSPADEYLGYQYDDGGSAHCDLVLLQYVDYPEEDHLGHREASQGSAGLPRRGGARRDEGALPGLHVVPE